MNNEEPPLVESPAGLQAQPEADSEVRLLPVTVVQKIKTYVTLVLNRCLIVREHESGTVDNDEIVIKKIPFPELDEKCNNMKLPRKELFMTQNPKTNDIELYLPHDRTMTTFKGGRMKHPCAFVLSWPFAEFEQFSCGWIISQFINCSKNVEQAGIQVKIVMKSPESPSELLFVYKKSKISENVEDVRLLLYRHFENGTQVLLRKLIHGPEATENLEFVNTNETAKTLLDMGKFLEIQNKYKEKHNEQVPLYKLRESVLNCDLMPYQLETVRWMVHKEVHDDELDVDPIWNKTERLSDLSLNDGGGYFYYPELGILTRRKAEWDLDNNFMRQFAVKGGILADEMGLGKTVQMLALIATNQKDDQGKMDVLAEDLGREPRDRQDNQSVLEQINIARQSYKEMKKAKNGSSKVFYNPNEEKDEIQCMYCMNGCSVSICGWNHPQNDTERGFICPTCLSDRNPRWEIKTTLVIVPESLISQWFSEIAKHCSDNLRVLFYFGIHRSGYLQPYVLDQYDVVLTTYDVLRTEMAFSEIPTQNRDLRNPNLAQFLTSSFVHVKFWRVVVDESQLVPRDISGKLAQMLLKIQAVNFWCVSGTPLVHSINDILSSFFFLDLYPFCFKAYFNQALQGYLKMCHERKEDTLPPNVLMESLSRIFSRKTKEDVKSQINLPRLVEETRMIQFTAIEERQYKEEKEKLKTSLKNLIKRFPDDTYLKDMLCRDKVLARLASLRGMILTGENLRQRGEAGTSNYIYSPDTILFRLMHMKKQMVLEAFRSTIANFNGVAGVYQLQGQFDQAINTYKDAFRQLLEIQETEKYIETTIGADQIKRLTGRTENPGRSDDVDFDAVPEEYEDDEDNESGAERKQSTANLREVKLWRKKFYTTAEEEKKHRAAIEKSYGGPDAKRRKKSEAPDDEIVDDQVELENEKKEQEELAQKMAMIAFKPMKMDGTQEVHLTLNLRKLQMRFDDPVVVPTDELKNALLRYMRFDQKCVEEVKEEVQLWTKAWDDKDYVGLITDYFDNWAESQKDVCDPDVLFTNAVKLQPVVLNKLLPYLPFNAFFDDGGPTKEVRPHNSDTCMGGCTPHHEPAMFVSLNSCLRLHEIITKTAKHLEYLNRKRQDVTKQTLQLTEMLIELSNSNNIEFLLSDAPMAEGTETQKTMKKTMECKHIIIKGTLPDKQNVLPDSYVENPCLVCELHTSICMLNFELGFQTFHGRARYSSGVLEFIKFLDEHFTMDSYESDKFKRLTLIPFIDRLKGFVKSHLRAVLICMELLDRFDELKTANTLITDELVTANLARGRHRASRDVESNRQMAADGMIAEMAKTKKDAKKHLSEVRYLTNLLKEQINGRAEELVCPICGLNIVSFMVFPCGHRVCMPCFEQFKDPKSNMNPALLSKGLLPCPSCRSTSAIKEVMVACGNRGTETVIPGIKLSAKMTAAIKLMKEIIEEDSTNKILLFTSIDQSHSRIWRYIQKILKQAKLQHWLLTKNACAKRLVEFQLAENVNILLCPLSFGANGLNITSANHIIFLDPPHLRSVLHQAMGRINRHGQKRDMKVWHLLVEGSLDMELRSSAMKENQQETENHGWTCGDIRSMFGINNEEHSD